MKEKFKIVQYKRKGKLQGVFILNKQSNQSVHLSYDYLQSYMDACDLVYYSDVPLCIFCNLMSYSSNLQFSSHERNLITEEYKEFAKFFIKYFSKSNLLKVTNQ